MKIYLGVLSFFDFIITTSTSAYHRVRASAVRVSRVNARTIVSVQTVKSSTVMTATA